MEKSKVFIIVLILVGVSALVFQAVGFFGEGWMSYEISVNAEDSWVKLEVYVGLWVTTGCVDSPELGEKICSSVSNDELSKTISGTMQSDTMQAAGLNFVRDITKVKILATFGGIFSIIGFVFTCLHGRKDPSRMIGVIAAVCWILGAILVFAAVGVQGQQYTNMEHGIDLLEAIPGASDTVKMETHFPWAVFMSGFGAGLGTILALLHSLKLCCNNDPNAPGIWKTFNNQAI